LHWPKSENWKPLKYIIKWPLTDPALLLKQGDLFARQGEMDKSIAIYQTALGLTDDNEEFLNRAILSRLTEAYAVSRRFEDAIETYQQLIKMTPDNAVLYYNTAAVYAIQGKISKARAFLKKAADKGLNVEEKIKTDPNFEKMREIK
jgi:tetratricopeptide (TPR) repeat protein